MTILLENTHSFWFIFDEVMWLCSSLSTFCWKNSPEKKQHGIPHNFLMKKVYFCSYGAICILEFCEELKKKKCPFYRKILRHSILLPTKLPQQTPPKLINRGLLAQLNKFSTHGCCMNKRTRSRLSSS